MLKAPLSSWGLPGYLTEWCDSTKVQSRLSLVKQFQMHSTERNSTPHHQCTQVPPISKIQLLQLVSRQNSTNLRNPLTSCSLEHNWRLAVDSGMAFNLPDLCVSGVHYTKQGLKGALGLYEFQCFSFSICTAYTNIQVKLP